MEKRTAESIIVSVYSIYAMALMFATTILGWPGWITPITSIGILVIWFFYLKELKDYRFRALLYSAVSLATFALYNTQENSFAGILTTYCAAIVVLSILDIPEIVVPEYVCSVLLVIYHGLIGKTIPITGCHAQQLKEFRNRVEKYQKFEQITLQKTSATISSNCGLGTMGIAYIKKSKDFPEKTASAN